MTRLTQVKIMVLRSLVFFTFLFYASILIAQNEYNIWYLGKGVGLDFNESPPKPIFPFPIDINEGESSTSQCDSNGSLLFYTNSDAIYNRNHLILKNSLGTQNTLRLSALQGCMALPVRGEPDHYYMIHGFAKESIQTEINPTLSFSIINMKGDNGLGEVVKSNVPIPVVSREAFAVTSHNNNKDYWIAGFDAKDHIGNSVAFKSYQLASPGVLIDSSIQYIDSGLVFGLNPNKFSPNSKIFAGNKYFLNNFRKRGIILFKFNNETGHISKPILLPSTAFVNQMSYEFSADSKFIYVLNWNNNGPSNITQYSLENWNAKSIVESGTIVCGGDTAASVKRMQLGPDKKIYVLSRDKISVIASPNMKGKDCDFQYQTIKLPAWTGASRGPYYPSFWFEDRLKVELPDELIKCKNDSLKITAVIQDVEFLEWSTGDTTNSIWANQIGWYWVEGTSSNGNVIRDSVFVLEGPKKKLYIGPDTTFCNLFTHEIDASNAYNKYRWSTNETTSKITVNSKGTYSVLVLDSNSCSDTDTISIDRILKPKIDLSYDSAACEFVLLSVDNQNKSKVEFIWNTGDTSRQIKVNSKGVYHITVYNDFCRIKDTIQVNNLSTPEVHLGPDTTICRGFIILSSSENGKHLWSNGEISSSINVQRNNTIKSDTIWLQVSRNNCSASDTLLVYPCMDDVVYIPSAFSPNSDKLNDGFRPLGLNHLGNYSFNIYNRWGEKIFESTNKKQGWTGQYLDVPVPAGVYFYMLNWKSHYGQMVNRSGTVTLIR